MSGRGRLTVCAAVATLASACALLPLVATPDWLFQAASLLALQSLVGALGRRVPLPRPLTVGAQVSVTLMLLTLVFTPGRAPLGLLPGPDALQALGRLLSQGTQDVSQFVIPAPLTDGIRLLLIGGVLVIGLAVDAIAVTYRSAAPAGLPLLALYSVAAGLSPNTTRWLWFLCAAVGYLLLLLAEGRERLSQWGQVFSGTGTAPHGTWRPPGPPRGGGRALAPVRTGRRIGALALGIAVLVPALLPSLGSGVLDPRRGPGRGPQSDGGTISAVNPLVALQDSLNQPENRTALTYTTNAPGSTGFYLRIVALDQFDGAAWKPAERRVDELPEPLPPTPGLAADTPVTPVTTQVTAADWYAQNWLPMPYPATGVKIPGRWRFEPEARTVVGDQGQSTRGVRYQVRSLVVRPTAERLADAALPLAQITREYTRVPRTLPPVVKETAQEVTRGATNAYERAIRLQNWFTRDGDFRYDTHVRAGSGNAAIVNFLKQREGFCVHFAFSMAAMARTLGMPARVAVGFTPGTSQGDGRMAVGLRDAHAWPELYFEGVGWTRFEPTPTRGSVPSYTVPRAPDHAPDGTGGQPGPRVSDGSDAQPPRSPQCEIEAQRGRSGCADQRALPAPDGPTDPGSRWRTALVAGMAALALLVLPLIPLLWRLRIRSLRLGGAATTADRPARGPGTGPGAGTATHHRTPPDITSEDTEYRLRALAVWRELVDSGWDYGIHPDRSATPRMTAARVVRLGGLDATATASAHRLADAVEQVLYAPEPRPTPGLADDLRRVRAGLWAAAGRGRRLRAIFAPRSAIRVVWAVSQRRSAMVERWRRGLRRIHTARGFARQRGGRRKERGHRETTPPPVRSGDRTGGGFVADGRGRGDQAGWDMTREGGPERSATSSGAPRRSASPAPSVDSSLPAIGSTFSGATRPRPRYCCSSRRRCQRSSIRVIIERR